MGKLAFRIKQLIAATAILVVAGFILAVPTAEAKSNIQAKLRPGTETATCLARWGCVSRSTGNDAVVDVKTINTSKLNSIQITIKMNPGNGLSPSDGKPVPHKAEGLFITDDKGNFLFGHFNPGSQDEDQVVATITDTAFLQKAKDNKQTTLHISDDTGHKSNNLQNANQIKVAEVKIALNTTKPKATSFNFYDLSTFRKTRK